MIVLPVAAAVATMLAPMHEEHFVGRWEGSLALPNGQNIGVVIKITEGPDGKLAATLDSPSQGAVDLPLSDVVGEDHVLRFKLAVVNGSFEGKLEGDDTIVGAWTQGPGSLPLTLKRAPAA